MFRTGLISKNVVRFPIVAKSPRQMLRAVPAFQYEFQSLDKYLDVLRSRLKIAVVYGGDRTTEDAVIYKTVNPRPWKSYRNVALDLATALKINGFEHVTVLPDDMQLPHHLKEDGIQLVWLNTGGVQGYSPLSHTAATLEMLGIPYIGHNPLHAAMLDNKDTFKRMLQAQGIKTAPFVVWHPAQGDLETGPGTPFAHTFRDHFGPFVIKPVSGRGSLHISVAEFADQVPNAARNIYRETHNDVMIEAYLPGREFCVAVCGPVIGTNNHFVNANKPFAFSTVERVLEDYELIFTSMDKKAITQDRIRVINEQEQGLKEDLLQLARRVYQEFNLNHLIRLDIRADAQGELHILEANPKPDLKRNTGNTGSLISLGLSEYSLQYDDLILSMLADRLHYLMAYNPGAIAHIIEMLV